MESEVFDPKPLKKVQGSAYESNLSGFMQPYQAPGSQQSQMHQQPHMQQQQYDQPSSPQQGQTHSFVPLDGAEKHLRDNKLSTTDSMFQSNFPPSQKPHLPNPARMVRETGRADDASDIKAYSELAEQMGMKKKTVPAVHDSAPSNSVKPGLENAGRVPMLEAEVVNLKRKLGQLQTEYAALKREYDMLREQNGNGAQGQAALESQLERNRNDVDQVTAEMQKLKAKNHALIQEVGKLRINQT